MRLVLEFIGVAHDFRLFRPNWLTSAILAGMLIVGFAPIVLFASRPIHSSNMVLSLAYEMPIFSGVLLSILFCWLSVLATKGLQVEFSKSILNVGDFSRWVVANAPEVLKAPPGQWSREQVSEVTRQIIVDMLGCEKNYREDADFVKDLGFRLRTSFRTYAARLAFRHSIENLGVAELLERIRHPELWQRGRFPFLLRYSGPFRSLRGRRVAFWSRTPHRRPRGA